MIRYIWNILIAIDQFFNTVAGGDPDETISSRLGKWEITGQNKKKKKYKRIYRFVNFVVELFERDHFKKSIEEDEGKNKVLK